MGMFDFPSVRLFCMAICRPEGCLIYNNRNVMVKKVKSLGGYRFFSLYLHVFKFIAEQIN